MLERRETPSVLPVATGQTLASYGQLPLSFEANQGQADPSVNFLSRGSGYSLFLTPAEAVLALHSTTADQSTTNTLLRLQLVDGNPVAQAAGEQPLPGISNHFVGNDPSRWRTAIPTFGQVLYRDVYPGINLLYYGNQSRLEYDFIVAPGADPEQIRLHFDGAQSMTIDAQGNLVLHTATADIIEPAPVVYQQHNGVRAPVTGSYVLNDGQVHFLVGAYDRTEPLVIDPVLVYSTYLGGSFASGYGIALDSAGNAYVTGWATNDFPTQNQIPLHNTGTNGFFVTKINATGTALVYSSFIGGNGGGMASAGARDGSFSIAVDADGNAYVTGFSQSTDFPTVNPIQATLRGNTNAFILKISPSGTSLVYSTYLGGSDFDTAQGIAVDAAGEAYITGGTRSLDFPTVNALQASYGGGISDAFVAKLNAAGSALVYSTYLGGSGNDGGRSIALDGSGNAYVTGSTDSENFPTKNPFQITPSFAAFVTEIAADGSALVYSSYLGFGAQPGPSGRHPFPIAVAQSPHQ